jgi:hypothetical protein
MQRAYESVAVLGKIDPVSQAAGTVNTTVVDCALFERTLFIVKAGVLGALATLDFVVKGDTASGGSFATTVTGKAITQLTKAGSDDSKIVLVEVDTNALGVQGFRYVRGTATVGVAASLIDVTVLGFGCSYPNANQHNIASVKEIV